MGKNSRDMKKSATEREAEASGADPAGQTLGPRQSDRAIKDAIEDDEVREALRLQHRTKSR
jgi:hypothetical protein